MGHAIQEDFSPATEWAPDEAIHFSFRRHVACCRKGWKSAGLSSFADNAPQSTPKQGYTNILPLQREHKAFDQTHFFHPAQRLNDRSAPKTPSTPKYFYHVQKSPQDFVG